MTGGILPSNKSHPLGRVQPILALPMEISDGNGSRAPPILPEAPDMRGNRCGGQAKTASPIFRLYYYLDARLWNTVPFVSAKMYLASSRMLLGTLYTDKNVAYMLLRQMQSNIPLALTPAVSQSFCPTLRIKAVPLALAQTTSPLPSASFTSSMCFLWGTMPRYPEVYGLFFIFPNKYPLRWPFSRRPL